MFSYSNPPASQDITNSASAPKALHTLTEVAYFAIFH
jgi:hypothetical protein